ncbi:hypothetical protein [Arcobacter sp. LA11]|uniref:hypothetical protein n=1 Tax=Arcobacter sp. LA11 TaxID=1898176 RepID=UPI0009353B76|nr:hypothetical protein [Arcobacter sp. LA11]
MKKILLAMIISASLFATQGWHIGKVKDLSSAYDGKTITFRLDNPTPIIDYTKCTCYSSWDTLCLNPARDNFNKEFSLLLSSKTSNQNVKIIFDKDVCFINAIIVP